jgi:membrane-associated phospholipid phosphatase
MRSYTTRGIQGRVWGMSDGIRSLKPVRAIVTNRLQSILAAAADRRSLREVAMDHATMYFGRVAHVIRKAHPLTARLLTRYYLHAFGHVYPGSLPPAFTKRHRPEDPSGMWLDLSTFSTPTTVNRHGSEYTFPSSHAANSWCALYDRYAA